MATVVEQALRLPGFPRYPPKENLAAIGKAFGAAFTETLMGGSLSDATLRVLLNPNALDRALMAKGFAYEVGREALRPITGARDLGELIGTTAVNFHQITAAISHVYALLNQTPPSSELTELGRAMGSAAGTQVLAELNRPDRLAERIGELSAQLLIGIVIAIVTAGAGAAPRLASLLEGRWFTQIARRFAQRLRTGRTTSTLRPGLRAQRATHNRLGAHPDAARARTSTGTAAKTHGTPAAAAPARPPAATAPPPTRPPAQPPSSGGGGSGSGSGRPHTPPLIALNARILRVRRRLAQLLPWDEFNAAITLFDRDGHRLLQLGERRLDAWRAGGNRRTGAVNSLKGLIQESFIRQTREFDRAIVWARQLARALDFDPNSVRFTTNVSSPEINRNNVRVRQALTDGIIYAKQGDRYLVLAVFESKSQNFMKLVAAEGKDLLQGQVQKSLARLETGAVYIDNVRVEPARLLNLADFPAERRQQIANALRIPVRTGWFGFVPKNLLKPADMATLTNRVKAEGRRFRLVQGPLSDPSVLKVAETILSELAGPSTS